MLTASGGVIVGGSLSLPGGGARIRDGTLAGLSVAVNLLDGSGALPFLTAAAGFAVSQARTERAGEQATLSAVDRRLSLLVGKQLGGRVSPYAGGSIFGGGVKWQLDGAEVRGGDLHHYQVLAGCSVALPWGLDAFLEGAPLGERALSGGAGLTF